MEVSTLLLVAFRHRIEEPDLDSSLSRVASIAGQGVDPNAVHAAVGAALTDRYIRDPVQLGPGALQCHWHLELTPQGVEQVLALLRKHGKTIDELLSDAGMPDVLIGHADLSCRIAKAGGK
jgi:hypothetical protein